MLAPRTPGRCRSRLGSRGLTATCRQLSRFGRSPVRMSLEHPCREQTTRFRRPPSNSGRTSSISQSPWWRLSAQRARWLLASTAGARIPPRPRAHHPSDTTHDQSHRSPDCELAFEFGSTQGPDFAGAHRPGVSEPPGPSGRDPSRAESSERAQVCLDAIRVEELRIDVILRAKQRDLQLVSDQLHLIETGRAAENDRARREFQQHQRDLQAFRARPIASTTSTELVSSNSGKRRESCMSSSIAKELTTSEPRLLRDFSETIHFGAIALRRRAPRWVRPRQALRQPQRPCPTNRSQKPAVTFDCVSLSRFVRPLALLLPSTQFSQFLLSACSLCGTSIVAPRPKSLGRTSPQRRPLLRASIDAKARHSCHTSVATHTTSHSNRLVAIGH